MSFVLFDDSNLFIIVDIRYLLLVEPSLLNGYITMSGETYAVGLAHMKDIPNDPGSAQVYNAQYIQELVTVAASQEDLLGSMNSEDPVLRRSHHNRLQKILISINAKTWESFDDCAVDVLAKFVHQGLNDVWSEVRKDSAKNLRLMSQIASERFIEVLVSRLVNVDSVDQWQHLHGSLLGLVALADWIKSASAAKYIDKIRQLCIVTLSHTIIPVRESAQDCFTSLFFSPADVAFLEHSISTMAGADLMNQREEHCFSIQSYLGCLQATLLSHTESVLCAILNGVVESPPEGGAPSPRGGTKMLQIIDQCMCHISSIVRLSAGTLLSSIYKSASSSDRIVICSAVIDLITVVVEDGATSVDWQANEGYLIVCNEIISLTVEEMINVFAGTRGPYCESMSASIYKLLRCLRNCLPSYVFTESFELRRIATHIIPPFARCILFMSEFQGSSIQSNEEDLVVDLLLNGNDDSSNAISEEQRVISRRKDSIVFFVLLSEFVKHTKLILEAIEVLQIGFVVDGSGGVDALSSGMLDDASAWAMTIPRRLGEEDFRSKLYEKLISIGSENTDAEKKLKSFSSRLIGVLETRLLSASTEASTDFFGDPSTGAIISADIIETLFLTYGLLNSLDRSIDDALLSTLQEKLQAVSRHIALIQLKLYLSPRGAMSHSIDRLPEYLRGADSDKLMLQLMDVARSDGKHSTAQFALLGSVMDPAIATFEGIERLDFGLSRAGSEDAIPGPQAFTRSDSYGANDLLMGDGIPRGDSKKLSVSSKEAVIDRFMCESISPTFVSIAKNLDSANCTFLIQLSYIWLDRFLSDPHWSSIKAASKKSILDFLGQVLMRLELSASNPDSIDDNAGLCISLENITAISALALKVLKLGLQRQENAICTTSIRTCRVLSELRRAARKQADDDMSVEEDEFSKITVLFKALVLKYMSSDRKLARTPSVNMDRSLDTSDIDIIFTSDQGAKFGSALNRSTESDGPLKSLSATITSQSGAEVVEQGSGEGKQGQKSEPEDEFSDWDDDEDDEESDAFDLSNSKSPQKLSKMSSMMYLDSEMDLFMRYV